MGQSKGFIPLGYYTLQATLAIQIVLTRNLSYSKWRYIMQVIATTPKFYS